MIWSPLDLRSAVFLIAVGNALAATLAVMSVTRRRRKVEIFYAIWFAVIIAGTAYRYFVPFTAAER